MAKRRKVNPKGTFLEKGRKKIDFQILFDVFFQILFDVFIVFINVCLFILPLFALLIYRDFSKFFWGLVVILWIFLLYFRDKQIQKRIDVKK